MKATTTTTRLFLLTLWLDHVLGDLKLNRTAIVLDDEVISASSWRNMRGEVQANDEGYQADLTVLALKSASWSGESAFSLPNRLLDTFADGSGLASTHPENTAELQESDDDALGGSYLFSGFVTVPDDDTKLLFHFDGSSNGVAPTGSLLDNEGTWGGGQ